MKKYAIILLLLCRTAFGGNEVGTADQVFVMPHTGGGRAAFGQVDLSQTAATKNQLLPSRGGIGVNASSSTGFAQFSSGTGSVSQSVPFDVTFLGNVNISGTTSARGPAGQIFMFGGTTCPTGSLTADGISLLRTGGTGCGGASCAALFTAIGTVNGAADGSHFNLPDLRGRFPRGANGTSSRDIGTRSAALTGGASSGVGSIEGGSTGTTNKNGLALTDPGHVHTATDSGHGHSYSDPGHQHGLPLDGGGGSNIYGSGGTITSYSPGGATGAQALSQAATIGITISTGFANVTVASHTTGITLGSGDAETAPVNQAVNFCIWY